MRLCRLWGIPIRISPLAFPMLALALWLGESKRMLVMSTSILFHESMHAAAARLLRVRVMEIELMPCGGAARLENLWRLRPGQMTTVALAGPAGNVLLMITAAALCWWERLSSEWTMMIIEQNVMIVVFNILPALPMDGGRVLCGLLSRRFSTNMAAKIGMYMAAGLSIMLMWISCVGLMQGKLNITLPMAALFLLVSVRREQRQAECAAIESLTGRSAELNAEQVLPMRWLAVRREITVREAAVFLKPRYIHIIAVYDEQMNLLKTVGEKMLINALLRNSDVAMGELDENINLQKNEKKC